MISPLLKFALLAVFFFTLGAAIVDIFGAYTVRF